MFIQLNSSFFICSSDSEAKDQLSTEKDASIVSTQSSQTDAISIETATVACNTEVAVQEVQNEEVEAEITETQQAQYSKVIQKVSFRIVHHWGVTVKRMNS